MKLLLLSDTHIRSTRPEGRMDNFRKAQKSKWKTIFEKVLDESIYAIVQAGDLFDKANPPYELLNEFIKMFNHYSNRCDHRLKIYTILGQHDLYMRSKDSEKTVLGTLEHMGIIEIIPYEGLVVRDEVILVGMSYGEDKMAEISMDEYDSGNIILVVHDMIGDKPLYPNQEITRADNYLNDNPSADLILCGDYHYSFKARNGCRSIINTGCLLRMTRDDRDMKRELEYYIYNTKESSNKNRLTRHRIHCTDYRDAFEPILTKSSINVDLSELVEQLKKVERIGIKTAEILESYFNEMEISESVRKIVREAIAKNEG